MRKKYFSVDVELTSVFILEGFLLYNFFESRKRDEDRKRLEEEERKKIEETRLRREEERKKREEVYILHYMHTHFTHTHTHAHAQHMKVCMHIGEAEQKKIEETQTALRSGALEARMGAPEPHKQTRKAVAFT